MNTRLVAMVAAMAVALPAPVWSQKPAADHAAHHGDAVAQPMLNDGEIRKVDKDARKLTIKHGPIPTLDMPAMTMVFQVKDAAMLDNLKPGDKVRFEAQKLGGAFTVTKIEAAK